MSFLGKQIYTAFLENAHKQTNKRNLEHHTIKTRYQVCIFKKIQMNFFLYGSEPAHRLYATVAGASRLKEKKFLLTLAL